MQDPEQFPDKALIEDLTWREQEILTHLARRLTNREIGDLLHLTESTVKSHVGNILGKLGVKNRRKAVERAHEFGLLGRDENAAAGVSHALPVEPTPFIGRAEELAEIRRLLNETRLLTLTGVGGIGKTRLALQAASDLRDQYINGVYFVALAPLNSVEQVVPAIAESLGFPLSTEEEPINQLLPYLRSRQLLLVLDNFEHLLKDVSMISRILQEAAEVRIIATARERLRLHGETTLTITGLDFPEPESSRDPQEHDAVKLFIQASRRVCPDFEPGADDLKHLVQICRLVEGMPLPIELAAGWMNVLSPEELVLEIQQSLDILASEMRDLPERHRSIRAVFNHSWSFLSRAERDVFMRLSVFRGGFTREAGQVVAEASLPVLAGLVNKSFLHHNPGSNRFEIHELLREYAEEKLEEEESRTAMEAHAAYFAGFMELRWQHLRDHRQKAALSEIDADLENIRTAWRYWVNRANALMMRKFVNSIWLAYWFRGWNYRAEELFGEAVEALTLENGDEETNSVRALALAHQGYFKTWLGFANEGFRLAKEGVEILERLNRPFELVLALGSLNLAADFLTLYDEGEKAAHKMLDLASEQGDTWLLAFSLYKVSVANPLERDYSEMRRVAQASMEHYEELGEVITSMLTLVTLGHAALALGEHAQAREIYLRCLRTSEDIGYRWGAANACKYLGQMALSLHQTAEAEAYLLRSLKIADETGLGRDQLNLLCDLARVQVERDRLEKAVELLAVVFQHPASSLHRLGGGRIRDRAQELLEVLKDGLPAAAYEAAWKQGCAREYSQVVSGLLAGL